MEELMKIDLKDALSSSQACTYLGISKATLYRWHKRGILVPDFINKRTKYRHYTKDQLDKFKENK